MHIVFLHFEKRTGSGRRTATWMEAGSTVQLRPGSPNLQTPAASRITRLVDGNAVPSRLQLNTAALQWSPTWFGKLHDVNVAAVSRWPASPPTPSTHQWFLQLCAPCGPLYQFKETRPWPARSLFLRNVHSRYRPGVNSPTGGSCPSTRHRL